MLVYGGIPCLLMKLRESAICLRTFDYSETSQVVHFFARDSGVVKLLAKGAKRPKSKSGGAMDILAEGDLVFSTPSASASLGTLMEFTETAWRPTLRKSADRLYAALYMLELTSALMAESDPHPEAFDLLHNALLRLDQADSPVAAVLAYFQWRILRHAGLLAEFGHCISCRAAVTEEGGESAGYFFSSQMGGLLCGKCASSAPEKVRISAETIAGLAGLLAARSGTKVSLTDRQVAGVNRLLHYHTTQQLGKQLKLAKHVIP